MRDPVQEKSLASMAQHFPLQLASLFSERRKASSSLPLIELPVFLLQGYQGPLAPSVTARSCMTPANPSAFVGDALKSKSAKDRPDRRLISLPARQNPDAQWAQLKKVNPHGFDVVAEATGLEKLANEAINYVRRGGTLIVSGVCENKAHLHWPPSKIFGDEIRVRFSTLGVQF
jgi:hypothetical protein